MFSIGEISKELGIKVPTIRFYEEAGLIDAPSRTAGNQRRYTRAQVERLSFIKHSRELGFSLESIRSLIDLGHADTGNCGEVDALAREHLSSVKEKIALLKTLEKELVRIVRGCTNGEVSECYVIESLARHDLCEQAH